MFQENQFGTQQGGATASLWLADSLKNPSRAVDRPLDWRARLKDWAEDVDLVPDLGQRVGSLTWFRGLATCLGLCATALYLSPGFQPVPGAPEPLMEQAQFDEVRSQMITPLAMGADSGHRMGSTDAVQPLRQTPERPRIELNAQIGSSDTLPRALSRAGVSANDVATVNALVGGDMSGGAKAGTRLDIVLGRRASRDRPRPLDHLAFRARLDLGVEINRVGGVLQVKRIPIRVDDTPLRIQGVVGDSVYNSARAAGAPPKAVQAFLRVIAQQMDLGSIHAGDRYDIVTEYRRAETGDVEVGDLLYAGLRRSRGKSIDMLKWTTGGRTEWFEASGVGERRGVLTQPVAGRISSGYGQRRHPILGYTRMHAGVDFAARYGSPIYAVTDGRVSFAGRHGGHGNYVRLEHGGGLATGYGHMSRIAAVSGQRVRRGQVIGYVGSTGLSTGPHLHYELYRNGRTVNPLSVTFTTTSQLAGRDLANFRARLAQLKGLRPGLRESFAQTASAAPAAAGI
ncbi:peptidoglycan DD-metalloendopeptidase family protein [Sphingobium baderi]|uniref:Membrane protein n=1 Tax=Sphingobium baderi LL03 TaxID=1114964 RepID=T0GRG2_9SPHN|nr:peptidoglycan DD-metalloendopeptidase family protein [Sphingobium baderi]EQB03252.1 membrane protein [Sphingobium baderi LL03]KMS62508.1 membrane protein [Sphingobium baderi LL03]